MTFDPIVLPGAVVRLCEPDEDDAVISLIASVAGEAAGLQPEQVREQARRGIEQLGTVTAGIYVNGRLVGVDQMRQIAVDTWYNAWFAMEPASRKQFGAKWMRALGQELMARYWDLGMRKSRAAIASSRPAIAAGLLRRGWTVVEVVGGWTVMEKAWLRRPRGEYQIVRRHPLPVGPQWRHEA